MKKQRFTESQIMQILKQAEGGIPVADLCREYGMSTASFYKWRSKYGGMDAALLSEMKAMAEENKRLKRMYAESQMQNELLKEALWNPDTYKRPLHNRENLAVVTEKNFQMTLIARHFGRK